jgi:putative oxidoreductase
MDRFQRLAALPLRLVLGFGLAYHGFPKLFDAAGHAGFVGMLHGLGFPAPSLLAWVVGLLEFGGGLALLAGAFARAVAALGIVEMAVALVAVHLPEGFNFIHITGTSPNGPVFGMPGYEVNLLYIAGLAALLLGGAGPLSVDAWRRRRGGG